MKGWRFALLIFELFLFALILVLPQVDLPDFTFPRGTAPIIVKSRLSSPPALSLATTPSHARSFERMGNIGQPEIRPAVLLSPLCPQTPSCLLRC